MAHDSASFPWKWPLSKGRSASIGDAWLWIVLGIVVVMGLPIYVVIGHLLVPANEVWSHLLGTVFWRYVLNSIILAFGVGLGSLIIGTAAAWLCSMCLFPGRKVFEWAMVLPLAFPTYAIGFTYAGLMDYPGPFQSFLRAAFDWQRGDYWFPEIRSLGGAIFVMSLVLYPYVYLLARNAFLGRSSTALEAAKTLGHGPWRSFFQVALPLARPALAGGVALAVMEALADFGTVQYFGVDTFTTGIFRTWFGLGDVAAATQLASVLLLIVFLVLLSERWSRGKARFHDATQRHKVSSLIILRGWRGLISTAVCSIVLLFAFGIPGTQLVIWTVATSGTMLDQEFLRLASQSFGLAALTGCLAVLLALTVSYGVRLSRAPATGLLARVAAMGYAIPGAVIAVGVILPLARFDNALDAVFREWFGVSTGLLLTGSIAALVFAYLVRFLAVALNVTESALGRVTHSMDDAARTLGVKRGRILVRIHLPLISGGLLTAGLMVFVDVMKELPATLIMRPFDFNTLAVRAYELAIDERLADSASASLTIVLVGLLPVVILSRAITNARPGLSKDKP